MLTQTLNDGPSVTNVTNLFRKAIIKWLCSLNYRKPGAAQAK